ncbi:FAD-dependent oxidoreductase (plasmid) [Streptomyces sp. CA-142005]|uniref:FAD-dependent oxidoreductase n=1 Tax=Streptomyces sp. CA-142005 TaxID=3240052 RepID=UPI003D8BC3A7
MASLTPPASKASPPEVLRRRIAVVGAGWYGCHMAMTLRAGGHDVHLFEALPHILGGASGSTESRLHIGFRYPRSGAARRRAREEFHRFKTTYPTLSEPVPHNVYALPRHGSLLDAETYRQIIASSWLPYTDVDATRLGLRNISAAFFTPEERLCSALAIAYFEDRLESELRLGTPVDKIEEFSDQILVNGEPFDAVVDCTNGAAFEEYQCRCFTVHFEPCVMFIYAAERKNFALTLVDGPFFSLHPYREVLYSLTPLSPAPLGRACRYSEARQIIAAQKSDDLQALRRFLETQVMNYLPTFPEDFLFLGNTFTVRSKMTPASDSQGVVIQRSVRHFAVVSGEPDAIFTAADQVRAYLSGAENDVETAR